MLLWYKTSLLGDCLFVQLLFNKIGLFFHHLQVLNGWVYDSFGIFKFLLCVEYGYSIFDIVSKIVEI